MKSVLTFSSSLGQLYFKLWPAPSASVSPISRHHSAPLAALIDGEQEELERLLLNLLLVSLLLPLSFSCSLVPNSIFCTEKEDPEEVMDI